MPKKLDIINPPFNSPITDLIIESDGLRKLFLNGTTQPNVFFEIKKLFQILESIGSARIEGNHTTIAEYIDAKDDPKISTSQDIQEIKNNELAIDFIEENIPKVPINRAFISELHKKVVYKLTAEGSKYPGEYRVENLIIAGSQHTPPEAILVNEYMQELLDFINTEHAEKYDLIKIALAHHRFVWIHPFDNGNGRTVRLLTYAMMIKKGFKVDKGHIINPTAVFCSDRDAYYQALQQADFATNMITENETNPELIKNSDSALLIWIEYVLKGLCTETRKIDKLLDYEYVHNFILLPALKESALKKIITQQEYKILEFALKKQEFKTTDLNTLKEFKSKTSGTLSRLVKGLRDKSILAPISENSRIYRFSFINNTDLMRQIMRSLDREGFLPLKNEV